MISSIICTLLSTGLIGSASAASASGSANPSVASSSVASSSTESASVGSSSVGSSSTTTTAAPSGVSSVPSGTVSTSGTASASSTAVPTGVSPHDSITEYWGQNANEKSLGYYCQNGYAKTYVIRYVDGFGSGRPISVDINGYTDYFPNTHIPNAADTIGADIKLCHSLGRKIVVSLGGPTGTYGFSSASDAQQVATEIWNLFGSGTSSTRPFGDAVVDGFNFDIRNLGGLQKRDASDGYMSDFLNALSGMGGSVSITTDPTNTAVESALPSTKVDSVTLDDSTGKVDANTVDQWADAAKKANPDAKVNVVVPASPTDPNYSSPADLGTQAAANNKNGNFAGYTIDDAATAHDNIVDGTSYDNAVGKVTDAAISNPVTPSSAHPSSSVHPSSGSANPSSGSVHPSSSANPSSGSVNPSSGSANPSSGSVHPSSTGSSSGSSGSASGSVTSTNGPNGPHGTNTATRTTTYTDTKCDSDSVCPTPTVTVDETIFTTWCPEPTTFTWGGRTWTITKPTTLTITSCEDGCVHPETDKTETLHTTYFTTYCPEPTTFTWGGTTVTITTPGTITLTTCPEEGGERTETTGGGNIAPTNTGGNGGNGGNGSPTNTGGNGGNGGNGSPTNTGGNGGHGTTTSSTGVHVNPTTTGGNVAPTATNTLTNPPIVNGAGKLIVGAAGLIVPFGLGLMF